MKTQNRVQLIGYVGKDPVITTTTNGSKLAKISLATDTFFKNRSGSSVKVTTWHEVVAWEKKAEEAENNFVKGSHILVEGQIVYRTYPDHAGHVRYVTEIKAQNLMNLDR
ncbi:MAG: ssb [Chitinophagaceae bacterium]|nr:ssb [Chitinophagaceae bacterium]